MSVTAPAAAGSYNAAWMSPTPVVQPASDNVSARSAACVGEARLVPASMNSPVWQPGVVGSNASESRTQSPLLGSASEAMSGTTRRLFGLRAATEFCHDGSGSNDDSPPPDPLHPRAGAVLPTGGSVVPPTATTYGDE